jgi:hypothetical protein
MTALELADIAAAVGVRMSTFFEDPVPAIVSHRSGQALDTADSQIDSLLAKLASEVEPVLSLGVDAVDPDATGALVDGSVAVPSTNAEAEALSVKARQLMGLAAGERNCQTTKSDIVEMNLHVPPGRDERDDGSPTLRACRGATRAGRAHQPGTGTGIAAGHLR